MRRDNHDKFNAERVYSSVVFCAVLCFLRLITSLIQLNIHFDETDYWLCNSINDITAILYVFVSFSVYLFLWIRQRTFFSNNMLNGSFNKRVRHLSKLIIIPLALGTIGIVVGISVINSYDSHTEGCKYLPFSNNEKAIFLLAVFFMIALGQFIMFGLFVYALKKNGQQGWNPFRRKKKTNKNINIELNLSANTALPTLSFSIMRNEPTFGITSPKNLKASSKKISSETNIVNRVKSTEFAVNTILRKTLYFALLSTFIDFVSFALSLFLIDNIGRRYITMILNISVFLNLVFVLFSFRIWRKILFFLCMKFKLYIGPVHTETKKAQSIGNK